MMAIATEPKSGSNPERHEDHAELRKAYNAILSDEHRSARDRNLEKVDRLLATFERRVDSPSASGSESTP